MIRHLVTRTPLRQKARPYSLSKLNPFSTFAAENPTTAGAAWEKTTFSTNDVTIEEGSSVHNALAKMTTHDVGCLLATNDGKVTGLISDDDCIQKVALLGKNSRETLVREIFTSKKEMLVGKRTEHLQSIMDKMAKANKMYVALSEDSDDPDDKIFFGVLSVKDVATEYAADLDGLLAQQQGS
mmetsp:Transcript_12651/g.21197  ORF Transcript_12651/g.21197 Transcript_12651/m.21197 type:complete len:183 (+) Transcript_12651:52-600(+)